ncbi:MAG: hypothetical protein JSV34_01855 [Candidatus Omnitrophota bacterium]|nr:MAG: hypothetical protein JSV34_01855 [Candidatus Omnitrophota bacterium]
MKTVYDMDDIFLALAVIFLGASAAMKLFEVSWKFILTTINPRHIFDIGVVFLLINIAINVHEICRQR